MKKHPIVSMFIICSLILFSGVSVAYYNTKTYAFDEDAVIFSRDNEGVSFLDYKLYYKDVKNFGRTIERYAPRELQSTKPYIVVDDELVHYIMCI